MGAVGVKARIGNRCGPWGGRQVGKAELHWNGAVGAVWGWPVTPLNALGDSGSALHTQ